MHQGALAAAGPEGDIEADALQACQQSGQQGRGGGGEQHGAAETAHVRPNCRRAAGLIRVGSHSGEDAMSTLTAADPKISRRTAAA